MALRTRTWSCALGIALRIAVPVAFALWIGMVLLKPRTVDNILRAIPMYPGAHDVDYRSAPGSPQDYRHTDWARMEYSVQDAVSRVITFYDDTLRRDGWEGLPREGDSFWLGRTEYPFEGIWFGGPAPWIHARQGYAFYRVSVSADDRWSDGQRWTRVSISLSQHPPPSP